ARVELARGRRAAVSRRRCIVGAVGLDVRRNRSDEARALLAEPAVRRGDLEPALDPQRTSPPRSAPLGLEVPDSSRPSPPPPPAPPPPGAAPGRAGLRGERSQSGCVVADARGLRRAYHIPAACGRRAGCAVTSGDRAAPSLAGGGGGGPAPARRGARLPRPPAASSRG